MSNLTIANEIKNQIGSKAFFMMGGKNLVGGDNYLGFGIRGSKSYNYIKVSLNSMDTYDVSFMKLGKDGIKKEVVHNGVYVDMLKKLIETETGLYLSL